MSVAIGSKFDSYEITSLLGQGAMGVVFRARDTKLGREVAVKVLPSKFANDPDRLSRFQREAQILAALNHPNILAIYDIGTYEGAPYVVSELLEGETLGTRLKAGAIPFRKVIDYSLQLANGLAGAHGKNIVHRDLKPENLFLTKDGRLKILDFGLAKLTQIESSATLQTSAPTSGPETEVGAVLGTVGYMSPEQARGFPVDHRSDLFSFGAICYEMLSGRPAFQGEVALDIMNAIVKDDPPELGQLKPGIPDALERVVSRCLAKAPDDRFQSARDLAFALETLGSSSVTQPSTIGKSPEGRRFAGARRWIAVAAILGTTALAGVFVGRSMSKDVSTLRFQRLTFRQGTLWSARFVSEGRSVVYSAAWDRKPNELFSTTPDSPESRSLGFTNADIMALSSSSVMALLVKRGSNLDWGWKAGTLAQASLGGGAPREILNDVVVADWMPDGTTFALVRLAAGKSRVELGIGKILYETPNRIGALRVSPKGDRIGFAERQPGLGGNWSVGVLDTNGKKEILSTGWAGEFVDLAWPPSGNELWFNTREGGDGSLHAVTLSGRHRVLTQVAVPLQLFDISRDGRALVARIQWRSGINGLPPGETAERDLSWLDASELDDVSQDGNNLLITEFGEGGGIGRFSVYIRKTDDSPAVRLGDGQAFTFSPDSSRALTLRRTSPPQLTMWPTGPGEPVSIKNDNIADYYWGDWMPDGKSIIFSGAELGHGARCYIQEIAGGKPRPITPEGTTLRVGQRVISPDGQWIIALDFSGKAMLYPIFGGEPRSIPGLEPGDVPIRWSVDERSLLVFRKSEAVPSVHTVDLATGRNELFKEIIPSDRAGIIDVWSVHIGLDDKSYYYSYMRNLSDLYLLEGLR